jgi:O-antigen ligase
MEKWVERPTNIYEFLFGHPWPLSWGFLLLLAVALASLPVLDRRTGIRRGLLLLPALWAAWQLISASHTVDSALTRVTLPHLLACAFSFYLGAFALSRAQGMGWFWAGLLGGYVLALISGWSQHFGGLEDTRRYFWTYIYPTMDVYPTDYIKKISSHRIFGTLFYPNTLAAGIILLFPPLSAKVWEWTGGGRFTAPARGFIVALWAAISLPCLLWSGSKGGWLVLMLVVLAGFFRWPGVPRKVRLLVTAGLLVVGLGAFFWTYSGFFKRGAPSVGARFDYWQAAVQNAGQKFLFGSGPGTFAVPYKELKSEESEMARLVHNDYLQQASDSGLPGFLFYAAFVGWALFRGMRVSALATQSPGGDFLVRWALWLGLAGWFFHSLIEFNLYIPALAWLAFLLMGWLLSSGSSSQPAYSGADSKPHVQT